MIALITSALQGLAALPELLHFLVNLNIDSRIASLEKQNQAMKLAFDLLSKAQTTEDKLNAADAISRSWNSRS